jgi:hypothetical protein
MAKKMYYSEEEAAQALGVTAEELARYVRDDKLRVFQDGQRKMFKGDEVEALVAKAETMQTEEEIELAPAEPAPGGAGEEVTLVDTEGAAASGKEDTVITAEGISIFDEEDLEIEPADPLAKTQIAPSMEDQIAIEGVGSGSGLLDLTRESDDTSLGAEVLDHIDEMEGAVGSGIGAVEEVTPEVPAVVQEVYIEAPAGEQMDAGSGLFGGIAIGLAVIMVVLTGVMLAVLTGQVPQYIKVMREQIAFVLVGGVFVVGIAGIIGLLVGKSAATRQPAR